MKAFEEIGGRVKVEEEKIPILDITRDFEPEPKSEPRPDPITKPNLFLLINPNLKRKRIRGD